tara:strand:+ start:6399 stop:6740 length:342 start_codon:yes stop_codon:yes gene_type:complete
MTKNNKRAYAGTRNTRIEIVGFTTVKNALNEDINTEVSKGFFYALLNDLSGAEDVEGKIIHIIKRTYTILYNTDIQNNGENMIIKDNGKEFRVYYVQEIGKNLQLLLKCTVRE